MVRPDHEDGEVLNSSDDTPDKPARKVVRRSSPLGRRKKPKPAVTETVEDAAASEEAGAAADSEAADEVDASPAAASSTSGEQVDVEVKTDADGPVDADEDGADEDAAEKDAADQTAADQDAVEKDAVEKDTADKDAAAPKSDSAGVEQDPDQLARNAAYRERRRNRAVVRRSTAGGESRDRSTLVIVAVALTGLAVVVGIVLSATFGIQYYNIKKDRELRAEYATFAQQMAVSMFTLNPDNADQMYKNVMDNTSGRARQMFKDNMKNTAKMIREGDMVTKTTVLADAVSTATDDEGSVLLVLDWEGYPKKDKKAAQSSSFRLRVDITRINGDLKMTYLDWVA